MGDEQLDDDLKNRIRQVFDNYHDNTAEDGWLLLREKYPEQRKPVIVWFWRAAGVAAILLIGLGIGLWLNYHPANNHKNPLAVKQVKATAGPEAVVKNRRHFIDTVLNNNKLAAKNTAIKPGVKPNNASKTQAAAVNSTYAAIGIAPTVQTLIKNRAKQPPGQAYLPSNPADSSSKSLLAYKPAGKAQSRQATADSIKTTVAVNMPGPDSAATPPAEKNKSIMANEHQKDNDMQSLFDNDNKYNAAQNTNTVKIKQKRVAFSVYAATFVSYAKGSSNQFNTGAGITSDIKLTPKLSISTGLTIAQNSLSYNNTSIPDNSFTAFPAAASYNFNNISNLPSPLIPSSKDLNASLVGIDIPVDLKYVFNPQKANIYVAAGLSSGTFINETYNYTYNYSSSYNPALQQSQNETTTSKSFENFYFAKMLDLSFGIGYPLGKNQLIIEPFIKYPLNGLGDQHILFGSGGLNLKINFDPPKKER